ncbi:hypothetical protein [Nocardia sp. NBC_00511]|uniref:hypothetical protein n=1 Tax=Nocardia sp. NBC_00511 TaxID=2903591 RepID=UPI0030E2C63C
MRLAFWRRGVPDQLTVDVLTARLEAEKAAAAAEVERAKRDALANAPTELLPKVAEVPGFLDYGQDHTPRHVRFKLMLDSDRYGGPEVTP